MRKKLTTLVATACCALAGPALAGTADLAVNVKAQVDDACVISASQPGLDLGNLPVDTGGVNFMANLPLTLRCSAGLVYTVTAIGANDEPFTVASHFLLGDQGNKIPYSLWWNSPALGGNNITTRPYPPNLWTETGDGTAKAHAVFVVLDTVPRLRAADHYSDQVTLSINY